MSTIKQLSDEIVTEKNTKIIRAKIKNNWGIFNVIGTLSSGGLNLFIQTTEPDIPNGIWLKSSTFTYSSIVEIESETNKVASSINIVKGNSHSTVLNDSSLNLKYFFDKIYLTDSNNDIIDDIETYYGNGEEWIDITPKNYTQLTYIQSSGTQYIDTGVDHINDSMTVELTFKPIAVNNKDTKFLGYDTGACTQIGTYQTKIRVILNNASASTMSSVTLDTNQHTVILSHTTKFDGTTIATGSYSITGLNMYIFNSNRPNFSTSYGGSYQFIRCKIYDENDDLIRDFIPVKNSENVVCVYDLVNKNFYYNLGTGSFTAGEEV